MSNNTTKHSLDAILGDIEQRLLEDGELNENMLKKAALATLLGLGTYAGLKGTDGTNTPLGQAMQAAANQGDEYAAQELERLPFYMNIASYRDLRRLSNKYLPDSGESSVKKSKYETKESGTSLKSPKDNDMNETPENNVKEDDDPCWDGYEQYGTKMQDGEEVPNCVPVSESNRNTEEETLLAAMKDSTIAESAGMTPEEARNSLRSIYGYDDLAIARAQLDETTSAGSVAAVSAPIGDTKKRNMSEEEMDNKDSEFDSAWFYKDIDDVEGPFKTEQAAKDAANDRSDWVKQGSELEGTDLRHAKRAFMMQSSLSESKTVSSLEKKYRQELNEAMGVSVNVDSNRPESKTVSVTATEEDADNLAGLLANAGLFSSSGYGEVQFQEPESSCGCGEPADMPMEDESDYSNSPDEKYQDMKYMLDVISGGLNREKNSYDKAEDGDNPMAVVKEDDTAVGTMDEFYSYVLDFYGPNGIYDFGATEEEVKKATEIVKNEVGYEFEGDSVDREKVRDVILDQMRSEEERKEAEKAFRPTDEINIDWGKEENVPDPIQTRGDVDDDMDRMRNFNETDEVKRLAGLV